MSYHVYKQATANVDFVAKHSLKLSITVTEVCSLSSQISKMTADRYFEEAGDSSDPILDPKNITAR